MTNETQPAQPAGPSRRNRILGLAAQVAGVIGIVIGFVLVAGVLLGRGWATERVDTIAVRIDVALAKGEPLFDAAATKVGEVATQVGALGDAATARAADPGPATALVQGVLQKANAASERYLELRTSYADARERVVSAIDRLNTIDRLVPAISVPQGPVDALATLDQRAQALDATVMDIINVIPNASDVQVAATIAAKAAAVETALTAVSTGLSDMKARVEALRGDVASLHDTANLAITAATIILILVLLYSVLLHWVLFRQGKQLRQGP